MKYLSPVLGAVTIELIIAAMAVSGGIGLITKNGLGLPISLLSKTPFQSFFWPGVILALVVGGTHILAALGWWLWRRAAWFTSAVAGFGIQIWLFTELYILPGTPHFLQVIFFGLGITELGFTFLWLAFHQQNSTL